MLRFPAATAGVVATPEKSFPVADATSQGHRNSVALNANMYACTIPPAEGQMDPHISIVGWPGAAGRTNNRLWARGAGICQLRR